MGHLSIWHWIIVLVIVVLLFGRGRIADIVGDMAKGVKNFRRGLADDDDETAAKRTLDHAPAQAMAQGAEDKTKSS